MELFWAITNTFMRVFQKNLAVVHLKHLFGRLKVKVTFEGQMLKWSKIELVWAITSTFIHGFQDHLKHLFR